MASRLGAKTGSTGITFMRQHELVNGGKGVERGWGQAGCMHWGAEHGALGTWLLVGHRVRSGSCDDGPLPLRSTRAATTSERPPPACPSRVPDVLTAQAGGARITTHALLSKHPRDLLNE